MPRVINKVSTGVSLSALHQVREVHHPALLVIHVHLGPALPTRDNDPVLQLDGARITKEGRILKPKCLSMVEMYAIDANSFFKFRDCCT